MVGLLDLANSDAGDQFLEGLGFGSWSHLGELSHSPCRASNGNEHQCCYEHAREIQARTATVITSVASTDPCILSFPHEVSRCLGIVFSSNGHEQLNHSPTHSRQNRGLLFLRVLGCGESHTHVASARTCRGRRWRCIDSGCRVRS